ncbi:1-deoxy-D-xylulose-5-phosphate synthase [Fusibacter tunisiensis]|uniref:1-deoxy-D-xylulose-5-phosphate synthase n=1 Tax=Fusibacter tunisiensis TaxID=1008308 RepID=A0ABS2MQ86_9FIRM|nr:1-deoxy-D-xylulose-5-phosphate synthase [Fusibacter tunisiensis]MBM7561561.1 1-deoxy-D-xylulose-5-phosphate synthase [Fusibacter tunisiensis]
MYKYLDGIKGPQDIKTLSIDELKVLAYEIRHFLVDSVSKTGGHMASNLGVVELTIALHYVFDSPKDHMIWDVSHQSYVHKLLTGRKSEFSSLRQLGGLSGFTKRSESEHDKFDTGHSSTSISAGLGIAMARDLKHETYDVVSIIGDGAMTGGMAFEAMNHLGHSAVNLKLILNDNEMSISENVGGLSRALNRLRTNQTYFSLKGITKGKLSKVPSVGDPMVRFISRLKGGLKYYLVKNGQFFEDLGITYIGPVDGHDLEALIAHLKMIQKTKEPVLLHVLTQKGKGYAFAEQHPNRYHGVGRFDSAKVIEAVEKEDYSKVFGDTLVELATHNSKIVAISAAMIEGTGLSNFRRLFPKRIFDVGISEQHAVTLGAGMATQGVKPYIAIYSTFFQRAYDQIIHDVCIQNLPVVFCIDRAGIVGNDGETHHGIFDISYLNAIPNLKILSPKDGNELRNMLTYSAQYFEGPIAIRYPRGMANFSTPVSSEGWEPEVMMTGEKIAVIATGKMSLIALEASQRVASEIGFSPTVIHVPQIKPMAHDLLESLVAGHKYIITVEDHTVIGGFGDAVLRGLSGKINNALTYRIGYKDEFIEQGDVSDLLRFHGLDAEGIAKQIKEVLNG